MHYIRPNLEIVSTFDSLHLDISATLLALKMILYVLVILNSIKLFRFLLDEKDRKLGLLTSNL